MRHLNVDINYLHEVQYKFRRTWKGLVILRQDKIPNGIYISVTHIKNTDIQQLMNL